MKSSGALTGFKKRRTSLRIIEDILRICVDGCKTTQIVYGTNIAPLRFKVYTTFLLDKGMLEKFIDDGRKVYRTTERGKRFIEIMGELADILEEPPDQDLLQAG